MYSSVLFCAVVLGVNQLSQTQATPVINTTTLLNEEIEIDNTSPLNEETEIDSTTPLNEETEVGSRNVCGPGKCSANETCVSWEKHCGTTKCEADVELEYHECFPKKGDLWDRMHPTAEGELCPKNETHEIIYHEQPCLKDEKPCNLLWRYKCVGLAKSPHSCTKRQCPKGKMCVEIIQCDISPPCMMKAV